MGGEAREDIRFITLVEVFDECGDFYLAICDCDKPLTIEVPDPNEAILEVED